MKRCLFILCFAGMLAGQNATNVVNTTTISFSVPTNATTPITSQIQVTTSANTSWTLGVVNGSWLTADTASHVGSGTATIVANPTGLSAGFYVAAVTVAFSQGNPSMGGVPVFLYVVPPVTFTAPLGAASIPSQTFSIAAPQGYTTSVSTAASDGNWLSVTPTQGTGNVTLTITATPGKLGAGSYSGSIFVSITGIGTEVIGVKMTLAGPGVTVTPTSLTFTTQQGQNPAPQPLMLGSTATSLMWTSSVGYNSSSGSNSSSGPTGWLQVSPGAGIFGTSPLITVNAGSLPPGTYNATIFFISSGSPTSLSVPVTLTVTQPPAGQIQVTPSSIEFNVVAGAAVPTSGYLLALNTGGTALGFSTQVTTANNGNWLSFTASSNVTTLSSPATITLSVDSQNLQPGVYAGSVIVTGASGSPITVPVQAIVGSGTQLRLGRSGLLFQTTEGRASSPSQNITVSNTGSGTASWTADVDNSSFLKVSPSSGSSAAGSATPPAIVVTADSTGLKAGNYYGLVRVTPTGGTPLLASAVLNVLPATATGVQATPKGLLFIAPQGGSAPAAQSVALANLGLPGVSVSAVTQVTTGAQWLSVTPATSTVAANGTVQVSATPGTLAPGVYSGIATFVPADGSPAQDVTVFLIVTPASGVSALSRGGTAACVPTRMVMVVRQLATNFSSTVGWPTNIETQMVDDCGSALTSTTVLATFSTGDPPLALVHLGGGIYSATWKPAGAMPATVTLRALQLPFPSLTQVLGGQVSANAAPPPSVATGGVVNGASFSKDGGLAPGAIVSIFGTNLATGTNGASFPLPTSLGNIKMTIGGQDMPLFFSNNGQVNAQVPFELPAATQTQIVARFGTGATEAIATPEPVTIASAQPGVFLAAPPSAQGVILNNPGLQVVDANSPATAGDVLTIYCTGLGVTTPLVATGAPAPSNPPATVGGVNAVTVTIGGVAAPVQFAGLTPGFVGLYQVNVAVPSGVTPGPAAQVVLTQNGVSSPVVTIAVR